MGKVKLKKDPEQLFGEKQSKKPRLKGSQDITGLPRYFLTAVFTLYSVRPYTTPYSVLLIELMGRDDQFYS